MVAYTYSVDAITIQKTRGIFSVDVVEFFVRNSENEDYSHDTFAIVTGGNNEDISERAVKFIRGIV